MYIRSRPGKPNNKFSAHSLKTQKLTNTQALICHWRLTKFTVLQSSSTFKKLIFLSLFNSEKVRFFFLRPTRFVVVEFIHYGPTISLYPAAYLDSHAVIGLHSFKLPGQYCLYITHRAHHMRGLYRCIWFCYTCIVLCIGLYKKSAYLQLSGEAGAV